VNYYRRFPGDYLRDTMGLSMLEHGAYTLLLDHIYASERRLRTEDEAFRVCSAVSREEKAAVSNILRKYFKATKLGFKNKRAEEEFAYAKEKSERAKKGAQFSVAARRKKAEYGRDRWKSEQEARKRGRHTELEWAFLVQFCGNKCLACGVAGIPLTKDHIISVTDGGSDAILNLQPLCLKCNSTKQQKTEDLRPDGWSTFVERSLNKLQTIPDSRLPDSKTPYKTLEEKKEAAPDGAALFSEPSIVPVHLWLAFVEMRKKIRYPLTDHAGELVRRELQKLKDAGHDPVECLENSIRNGWRDVFEPRKENNGTRQPDTSREQQRAERSQQAIKNALGHRSRLADTLRANIPGRNHGRTSPALPGSTERHPSGGSAPGVSESSEDLQIPPDTSGGKKLSGNCAGQLANAEANDSHRLRALPGDGMEAGDAGRKVWVV